VDNREWLIIINYKWGAASQQVLCWTLPRLKGSRIWSHFSVVTTWEHQLETYFQSTGMISHSMDLLLHPLNINQRKWKWCSSKPWKDMK
jgi:hypothetical protein